MPRLRKVEVDVKQEDWHYCHTCQVARGGRLDESACITVMEGKCSLCKKVATLIPTRDYDWPKQGRKAWFD